jgi:hypothetical protein
MANEFVVKHGLVLRDSDNSNYVGFKAPALTGDQIWVLPNADGTANQVLETDGNGNLSWATVSGGGVGGLSNVVEDISPQLGGDLDLNGNNVHHPSILTSNGTYQGTIMTVTVDDASAAFGNVLYQASDFNYERADADAAATGVVLALALEAGNGSKKVLLSGQCCNTSWNWNAGLVYLSATTGEMTQSLVSGSGQQSTICGFALSADTIYFNPQYSVVEVA